MAICMYLIKRSGIDAPFFSFSTHSFQWLKYVLLATNPERKATETKQRHEIRVSQAPPTASLSSEMSSVFNPFNWPVKIKFLQAWGNTTLLCCANRIKSTDWCFYLHPWNSVAANQKIVQSHGVLLLHALLMIPGNLPGLDHFNFGVFADREMLTDILISMHVCVCVCVSMCVGICSESHICYIHRFLESSQTTCAHFDFLPFG